MKKILLIIAITLLMFQMIVLATAIDIGSPAINRASWISYQTSVQKTNPANASGKITSVEIWAYSNMSNCEVATFYVVSGNNLSTRDTQAIGSVSSGSKQTFEVDLNVQEGDYIGIYYETGGIEMDVSGGAGKWYKSGDNIPCTDVTFGFSAGHIMSLYGTGATEEEEEEANAIFFGTAF